MVLFHRKLGHNLIKTVSVYFQNTLQWDVVLCPLASTSIQHCLLFPLSVSNLYNSIHEIQYLPAFWQGFILFRGWGV